MNHECDKPAMATGLTAMLRPDWQCGDCGRVYSQHWTPVGMMGWIEVVGAAPLLERFHAALREIADQVPTVTDYDGCCAYCDARAIARKALEA